MKDTTLFASSMDTTLEEDIALLSNTNNIKKMNSYDIENMIPNFSETSSIVHCLFYSCLFFIKEILFILPT